MQIRTGGYLWVGINEIRTWDVTRRLDWKGIVENDNENQKLIKAGRKYKEEVKVIEEINQRMKY